MTIYVKILYYFAMNTELILEQISHETEARPFSIHHTFVGEENTNALYLHCHPEAEFFYLEEGAVTFCVENLIYELHAGDGMFIPPKLAHNANKELGMACRYSAVVFSVDWLAGYLGGTGNLYTNALLINRYDSVCSFRKERKEDALMLQRLDNFRAYMGMPIQSYEMKLLGELMISLQELYNSVLVKLPYEAKADAGKEGVQRAVEYINQSYGDNLSLARLAKCAGYSESYFCHRFKAVTGYTPFSYLNRVRIIKAAERLVLTDDKITGIALKCGFENISYFNRVFRKQMEMAPSEYRASGRQNREASTL